MKTKITEKYTYRVEWSEEDQTHVARCLEFPSLAAHGHTVAVALHEIQAAVAAAIEWMKEEGETLPEPLGVRKYKGNLTLRVPPELHRKIAVKSAEEGVSINQYILSKLT